MFLINDILCDVLAKGSGSETVRGEGKGTLFRPGRPGRPHTHADDDEVSFPPGDVLAFRFLRAQVGEEDDCQDNDGPACTASSHVRAIANNFQLKLCTSEFGTEH